MSTYPTIPDLRRAGRIIRAACERLAPLLGYGAEDLPMFCPIAGVTMVDMLAEEGIASTLVAGKFHGVGHFWANVKTGSEWWETTVLDVTATQFYASWPRVCVLAPHHRKRKPYGAISREGPGAVTVMFPHDADLLRVLPTRWWALEGAALRIATLDARILVAIREKPCVATRSLARRTRTDARDVSAALGRLAGRAPLYDLPPGQHGALLVPPGGMPRISMDWPFGALVA